VADASGEPISARGLAKVLGRIAALRVSHGNITQIMTRNTQHRLGWIVNTQGWEATLVVSTISKRKQKRSDIEAYYRNESKTFWFGPLKGTVAWNGFLAWSIPSGVERKDLKLFFIWTIINWAKPRFWSLSAVGEGAEHGCASSPTTQNTFFLAS
jgi:hypothetical protein